MHKTIRTILLLFVFMSFSSLCFAQHSKPAGEPPPPPAPSVEYNPAAWKEFSSSGGRFSVLLPGTPVEKVEVHDSPVGKLEVHDFTLRTSVRYGILYVEYPPNIEEGGNVKAFLDGRINAGLKGSGGTLLEQKDIILGGHPGRYARVQMGDGYVMRVRIYVVKNRLYQIGLTMREAGAPEPIAKFHEETAAKFFDSFKLVSGVADTPHPVVNEQAITKPDAEGSTPPVKTEGEADRLLKSLREKGESVYGVCEEGTKCQPLPDIEGVTAEDVKKGITIKVISKSPPVYPAIAKAARAQGAVTVQVVVDEEGRVIAAQAVSGHPLLYAAAVKAAREVLFSPVLLGTKPVKVAGVITYNFVLQ